MARYKAEAKLFVTDPVNKVGRLVRPGEYFESNDPPGKHWIAEDDEAKKRVEATPPGVLSSREVALKAVAVKRTEQKQSAKKENEKRAQANLKARAKAPTPGKSVAEQQTLGEEPTRD